MKRMFGLVMMMGLVVSVVGFTGCGGDSDSPTGPSEITKGPQGQTLEVETEKWDNGNIKAEFEYYRDGGSVVRHGWYKEYYEDGNILLEATAFEGEHDGEWTYYHLGGEVKEIKTYVRGKAEGKWVSYYDDGQIEKERHYVDNLLEGKWVSYYPTGRLMLEWNFVGGKEEGKWVYYYPEADAGTRWEEIYVNGQLENKVGFYKNGNVWFEESYVDGSKHGKFIDYDEDGNITDEDIWKNGECVEMCEGDE